MRNDNPYKIISTKIVYKNPWITVNEDKIIHPDGHKGVYGVVNTNDSVAILPVNENEEILLIYAYSYPSKKWHWELPAGGVDNDNYLDAAKRELFEETGMKSNNLEQIGLVRPMDGLMKEKMALIVAKDLKQEEIPEADDNGVIDKCKFFDLDTIRKMIKTGMIDEGATITGLYYYELRRKNE